jgi:hypothetical protein
MDVRYEMVSNNSQKGLAIILSRFPAFQTAIALAIADSKVAKAKGRPEKDCIPQVTEAHLKQVVAISGAFKHYIKATHEGIEDADLAYKLGNRFDYADVQ